MEPAWLNYQGVTRDKSEAVTEGVRAALDGRSLTREQLAAEAARVTHTSHPQDKLRSGWDDLLKSAAYRGYLCFGPSQVRTVTFACPDQWFSSWREYDSAEALATAAREYLAAYGPAPPEDFSRWWRMKPREARKLFQQLGEDFTTVEVEGWTAWMLAMVVKRMPARPLPRLPGSYLNSIPMWWPPFIKQQICSQVVPSRSASIGQLGGYLPLYW